MILKLHIGHTLSRGTCGCLCRPVSMFSQCELVLNCAVTHSTSDASKMSVATLLDGGLQLIARLELSVHQCPAGAICLQLLLVR